MDKIPKLIIFFIIIIIIILFILIALLNTKEYKIKDEDIIIEEDEDLAEKNANWHVETSRNRVYEIKNIIIEFYRCYEGLNTKNIYLPYQDTEIDYGRIERKYAEKIYAMLDKEYIEYKNITVDNMREKLGEIEKTDVLIDNVYTKDLENSTYISFVEGRLKENNSNIKNFKMIIRLGEKNTFKLFLEDYLIEKNYNNFSEEMDLSPLYEKEISNDTYNTYISKAVATQEYINDLFKHYKETVIYDYDYSYELINDEYKRIRFENKEEYLTYAEGNLRKMLGATLSAYNKEEVNGFTYYTCQDNYENYYIFKETAPFQYTVILDNYTLITEEYKEKYNSSSEEEKVVLNIKKFFMGIDDENYGYSYNVLSEGFKENKYPTKNDFINYAKQNFFKKNDIEYISYEKENGIYIYKINLKDANENNSEEKQFNMIIKLNEGTDFEMSFGTN